MAKNPAAPPASLSGVVLRSFYYGGQPQKVGAKLELPRAFALEMKAANKFAPEQSLAAPVAEFHQNLKDPERQLAPKAAADQPAKKGVK